MTTLFAEGGFPMWFLLVFGLAMLGFATRFAWIPARRTLRITLALGGATAFTTLTAIAAALAMVGHHAPDYLVAHPGTTMTEVILQGIAESLSPGIFGFTMLSLTGLIVAVGFHREASPS